MKNLSKYWKVIVEIALYAIPIFLVLTVFVANRSLFLDGLNLARNVAEGSFMDLSLPLKYEQSAPLLFLFISKIFTSLLGVSEYSLRLLPLLSGVAFLIFFGKTLHKVLPPPYPLLGIIWIGTHAIFIRYATEYKQYISDAFVCVFLVWLALRWSKLTKKTVLLYALAGTIGIWLSMPSVFVLFGVIIYYAHIHIRNKYSLWPITLLALWLLLNFALEYTLVLSTAIQSDLMQNYHQNYFLQGRFWDIKSLQHDFGLVVSMVRMVVGKSGIAIAVTLGLILISLYHFVKTRSSTGLLLFLPLIAVFGASLFGKYSLIERLMIFTLPLLIMLILMGIRAVTNMLEDKNIWIKYSILGIIGISFLIGYVQSQGFKYILDPFEKEDNRSALLYISKHESNSKTIICTQHAYPAYAYYTQYDKNYKDLKLGTAIGAKYGDSVEQLAMDYSKKNNSDVWILMGHMSENNITVLVNNLEEIGEIKNSYRTNHSAAILFSTQ